MAILILGDESDPHVEAVRSAAQDRGGEVFVFNFRDDQSRITLSADQSLVDVRFISKSSVIHASQISAVWWRVKPLTPDAPPENPIATSFKNREWEYVLRSLPSYMPDGVLWINPIFKQLFLNYKPNQLPIALRSGLVIPPTVFSNHGPHVLEKISGGSKIVYKTISPFVDPPNGVIMTNFVDQERIASSSRQIAICPGTFQQPISKAFELRVYLIGEEMFSFRIESQLSVDGKLDWRRSQSEDIFHLTVLNDNVADAIRKFQSLAEIVYGAYDLIVSKDGQTYFLECNPGGQWLWLEHATGAKIADKVASLLCEAS